MVWDHSGESLHPILSEFSPFQYGILIILIFSPVFIGIFPFFSLVCVLGFQGLGSDALGLQVWGLVEAAGADLALGFIVGMDFVEGMIGLACILGLVWNLEAC